MLGYHFPLMSAPGIDVDALPRLTDVGVVGLKDSSGDPSRLVRTLETFAGDLYVGSPWLLSAAGPLGATGAILAVADVEPELSIAAFDGDAGAQRSWPRRRSVPPDRPASRPSSPSAPAAPPAPGLADQTRFGPDGGRRCSHHPDRNDHDEGL